MKKLLLYGFLCSAIAFGGISCKAKHCPAYDDTMDGYKPPKKKKKRQEGLFPRKMNR